MAKEDNKAEQPQQAGFSIEKIYVKDASLEIPNAPQIFTDRTQPQIGIELGNFAQMLEDGVFEVAIKVTVTSKIEDKTVFLVEVTQAGIFQIRNVPEDNIEMGYNMNAGWRNAEHFGKKFTAFPVCGIVDRSSF